jgi:hypothetical protein
MSFALKYAMKKRLERKKKEADLSPEEVAERKRRRSYRWKIIIGLFGPFTLQALDTTVIASAFPYIATDFSTYSSCLPLLPQPNASGRLIVAHQMRSSS